MDALLTLASDPRLDNWLEEHCSPAEIQETRAELLALAQRWDEAEDDADLEEMESLAAQLAGDWLGVGHCDPLTDRMVQIHRAMHREITAATRAEARKEEFAYLGCTFAEYHGIRKGD